MGGLSPDHGLFRQTDTSRKNEMTKDKKIKPRDDKFLLRWQKHVWDEERSGLSRNGILVLLGLSTFMDSNGHNGYPSIKALMARTRTSRTAVKAGLTEGEKSGLIKKTGIVPSRGGGKPINKYSAITPGWAKNKKPAEKKDPEKKPASKNDHNKKPASIKTSQKKSRNSRDNILKRISDWSLKESEKDTSKQLKDIPKGSPLYLSRLKRLNEIRDELSARGIPCG